MHQCTTGRAAPDWSDWELGLRHPLGMCSSTPETSAAGSQGTKLQQSPSPGCVLSLSFARGWWKWLQPDPGISGVSAFTVMSTGRRFAASQGEVSGVLKGAERGVGRKGSCSHSPPGSFEVA